MALTDNNLTVELLSNPINTQHAVLEDLEARLGGTYTVVDPNSTSMFLLEMISNLTSNFANACAVTTTQLTPTRAQTMEDLFKHMSDYDYINLYSAPAVANVQVILDKNYLFENSLEFNSQYNKVIIPKNTLFQIGTLTFGIFYPIEIRINKYTQSVICVYDTSETFPGQSLDSNVVSFVESNHTLYTLLMLTIPVYQLSSSTIKESLTSDFGFNKKYNYTDKFYVVRIFTTVNGETIELKQTLSENNYDPFTPTARISIDEDNSALTINIPQVYFNNNQMGNTLSIELYTTKGDIRNDISQITPDKTSINFRLDKYSSPYSTLLSKMSVAHIAPVSTHLAGGSDGYGFDELKERVINSSFHPSLLVTPMDIENYFEDKSMKIVKYEDNLTKLTFFAYKTLIDTIGTIIPSINSYIKLNPTIIASSSTIIDSDDGTVTLLPTTIYKYSEALNYAVPLTNEEISHLNSLDTTNKVNFYNNGTYVKSPFHLRLIPDSKYPIVDSYNLMNPSITNFVFERENIDISAQMTTTGGTIVHLNNGTGSYKLRYSVNKSKDLIDIPEDYIKVYVHTTSNSEVIVGTTMNFIGILNNSYVYETDILTDYNITRDSSLGVTNFISDTSSWKQYIPLTNTYYVTFCVSKAYFPGVNNDYDLVRPLPDELQNEYIAMNRQSMVVSLGNNLSDVLYNNIDLLWGTNTFETYPVDVPLLYENDIYATNDLGVPIYTVIDDNVVFHIEHKKGDPVYNTDGTPAYKHKAGDIVYDDFRTPIVAIDRTLEYYIQTSMVDAKLYVSEQSTNVQYAKDIPSILESYFTVIRTAKDNLLEKDDIYLRLINTLGSSKFTIGDGVTITLPLNMSIKFKCHVDSVAYSSESIQSEIINVVISEVETAFLHDYISMTEICNNIKSKIVYIDSIDVLGINGITDLQTIAVVEDDVRPSIAQELYVDGNNSINIRKKVDVEFVLS